MDDILPCSSAHFLYAGVRSLPDVCVVIHLFLLCKSRTQLQDECGNGHPYFLGFVLCTTRFQQLQQYLLWLPYQLWFLGNLQRAYISLLVWTSSSGVNAAQTQTDQSRWDHPFGLTQNDLDESNHWWDSPVFGGIESVGITGNTNLLASYGNGTLW